MPLTELVRPRSVLFTTLARMKRELGIAVSDTTKDQQLSDVIREASDTLTKEIGYQMFRSRVRETLVGEGRSELLLKRTPIVKVESVTVDGVAVAEDQFIIEPDQGVLYHENAWQNTRHFGLGIEPFERPDGGRHKIAVDYWAGVFGPDEDIAASGIVIAGSTETFVVDDPPLLLAGDIIEATGFAIAGNNGQLTVAARTASGIEVDEDLTTEVGPAGALIKVRNLDYGLERLCIQTVKAWIVGSDRDPAVTSERIGDWAASYGGVTSDAGHELPPTVVKALNRWRRIV